MPVVINDFEVAPAPPPAAAPPAAQAGAGGAQDTDPSQPESMRKIERVMRVAHERRRRLAAY